MKKWKEAPVQLKKNPTFWLVLKLMVAGILCAFVFVFMFVAAFVEKCSNTLTFANWIFGGGFVLVIILFFYLWKIEKGDVKRDAFDTEAIQVQLLTN